jgi:hypothetical protein
MNAFLQGLLTNSPVLVGLVFLYVMIIKQGHKMELGFLKINNRLKKHTRYIKDIKKRVHRLEKR